MKRKLYLYNSKYGTAFPGVVWDDSYTEEKIDTKLSEQGDFRVSEIIEVDFPELPQDVVIDSQIQAIDNIITQKEGEHFAAIQALKQKRQELLAITHQAEAIADWENPSQEQMKADYEDAN